MRGITHNGSTFLFEPGQKASVNGRQREDRIWEVAEKLIQGEGEKRE